MATYPLTGTGTLVTARAWRQGAGAWNDQAVLRGKGKLTATIKPKFAVAGPIRGTGTLTAAARMYRIASVAGFGGSGSLVVKVGSTYPYLSGMGWFTEGMYRWYALGALIRQPVIEPGSMFYDPETAPSVLDDMAITPTPFAPRWGEDAETAAARYKQFK